MTITTRDLSALRRAEERYRLSYRTATTMNDAKAWMDVGEALRPTDPSGAREAYAQAQRWALGFSAAAAAQEVRSLDRILDGTASALDHKSPTKADLAAAEGLRLVASSEDA